MVRRGQEAGFGVAEYGRIHSSPTSFGSCTECSARYMNRGVSMAGWTPLVDGVCGECLSRALFASVMSTPRSSAKRAQQRWL